MNIDQQNFSSIMHLLQLSDSALPTGAFSFSNTLESAVTHGVVYDDITLEQYVMRALRTVALTDGVTALFTRRKMLEGLRDDVVQADNNLLRSKLNDEARQMSLRMGRKLADLMQSLLNNEDIKWWHDTILNGHTAGTYAATQGIVAALCNIDQRELFCSLCYGSATMMLGAALRCTRTTHIATQRILFNMGNTIDSMYDEANEMSPYEINAFSPQMDIMAALHEKGDKRLFMN